MSSTYYIQLAILFIIVATFASYTAFDLAGRIAALGKGSARLWLPGATLTVGVGVWSMFFIGQLSSGNASAAPFSVPVTLSFMLLGMGVSGLALYMAFRLRGAKPARLVPVRSVSALIMVIAITSMCLV